MIPRIEQSASAFERGNAFDRAVLHRLRSLFARFRSLSRRLTALNPLPIRNAENQLGRAAAYWPESDGTKMHAAPA